MATRRFAFAASATLAVLSTLPALAADITLSLRNDHPNAVRVELYSQDRNHIWPGGGKDYYLDDGESKRMSLACNQGETICYGAWLDGDEDTYWGVGPGNTEDCSDCCYVCEGGETEEIILSE